MHRPRNSLLAGAALLLAAPLGVTAQTVPSAYRYVEKGQAANVFLGTHESGTGTFDFGPGNGVSFGARYSLELSGPLAIEGVGTYVDGTRKVVDPAKPVAIRVIGEEQADLLFIEVRLRMSLPGRRTWHGFTPFVFGGIGLGFGLSGDGPLDAEIDRDDRFRFNNAFNTAVGGGFRYFLSDRWALRVDASLTLYRLDIPDGYLSRFPAVPQSEWVNSKGLSVGLSTLF